MLGDDGKAKPMLALSWSHSDDYRTWTFKLRPDVKFSDGTPFNAEAVKWNFDRQKDPRTPAAARLHRLLHQLSIIDAKDELTVVFNLRDPAVDMPALLTRPDPGNSSMHYAGSDPGQRRRLQSQPVGTGYAFVVEVVDRHGDRTWWWSANPTTGTRSSPISSASYLRPLPDSQSRFASLKSGETDLVWADEFEADNIIRQAQARIRVAAGAEVRRAPARRWNAINTKVAPLDDVRVRQALVMAIDRQEATRRPSTNGLARPATNPYGDGSWVKCKDDGAAGATRSKAAGRIKEYGKPVSIQDAVHRNAARPPTAQVFQQFWKNISVQHGDRAGRTRRPSRHAHFQREFDIIGWRIVDFPDPDVPDVRQLLQQAKLPSGPRELSCSPSSPASCSSTRGSRPTQAKRTEDNCAVSRILNNEGDLVLDLPEHLLWDRQSEGEVASKKMYGGIIDISPRLA